MTPGSIMVKDFQSQVTFLAANLRNRSGEIGQTQNKSDHADEGFADANEDVAKTRPACRPRYPPIVPSSQLHSTDSEKGQDITVIDAGRVDETRWRIMDLTGVRHTPSPVTIAKVNNVIGRYQAARERTQTVAGEHPCVRCAQGHDSG